MIYSLFMVVIILMRNFINFIMINYTLLIILLSIQYVHFLNFLFHHIINYHQNLLYDLFIINSDKNNNYFPIHINLIKIYDLLFYIIFIIITININ